MLSLNPTFSKNPRRENSNNQIEKNQEQIRRVKNTLEQWKNELIKLHREEKLLEEKYKNNGINESNYLYNKEIIKVKIEGLALSMKKHIKKIAGKKLNLSILDKIAIDEVGLNFDEVATFLLEKGPINGELPF